MTVLHDGREVGLPHPCEDEELKKLGLTREKAALRGQLFQYRGYVCKACGAVVYVKSLIRPNGCEFSRLEGTIYFVTLLIICGIHIYYKGFSNLFTATIIAAFLLPVMIVKALVIRKWVSHKFGFAASNNCEHCGATQLLKIGDYIMDNKEARFYCRDCEKRTTIFTHWSIS